MPNRQATDTSGATTPSWSLMTSQVVPQMSDGTRKRAQFGTGAGWYTEPPRRRGRPTRSAALRGLDAEHRRIDAGAAAARARAGPREPGALGEPVPAREARG